MDRYESSSPAVGLLANIIRTSWFPSINFIGGFERNSMASLVNRPVVTKNPETAPSVVMAE
jgi:hypothetical protein